MSTNNKSIEEKIKDLEKQIAWFDSDEFAIEKAIENYEHAKKLADEIVKDIETVKNEVTIVNKSN